MRSFYLKLFFWTLLSCGVGIILLITLTQLGALPDDFSYKGAIVFAVTLVGGLISARRLPK